ncbi:MAG: hypothetical protein ACRC28_15365, partial [Clostridium sp.]|uniref:hypothetical protein n=1 Tax=Clostridium sp. TaxID=1506 RepID=UPI003F2D2BB2
HKASTRIIPYVMTWDGVVTKYHRRYIKDLGIQPALEAYIQSVVLKKTLESISLDHRRGYGMKEVNEDETEVAVEILAGTMEADDLGRDNKCMQESACRVVEEASEDKTKDAISTRTAGIPKSGDESLVK